MVDSTTGGTDPATGGWDHAVVVGLGNPGPDYAGHRHNVGAMAVAELATAQSARLKRGRGKLARVVSSTTRLGGGQVVLATLTSYMNESGQVVRPLLDYYKIDPGSLIVLHDELDLPFGTVRIKQGGGDNGHNGLRSITRSLSTPDYVRVRIGIGRPIGSQAPADFVLRDFTGTERRELPDVIALISHAVTTLIGHGVTYAQNEVHPPRS